MAAECNLRDLPKIITCNISQVIIYVYSNTLKVF